MTNAELKKKFEEYDKAKDEFAKTHESIKCRKCGREIKPGDDIYVNPFDGFAFCCDTHALEYYDISEVIYNKGDSNYESWFPEKENEQ